MNFPPSPPQPADIVASPLPEVLFYRAVKGLQAPASRDDDTADGEQRVLPIHFVGQLEGRDKPSFFQFGDRLAVPKPKRISKIMDRLSGDGFELFRRFVDLDRPVISLVFFY